MATDELQPQQEEQRECIVCGRSLPAIKRLLAFQKWRTLQNLPRLLQGVAPAHESRAIGTRTAPSACACHIQGQNAARNNGHYAGWQNIP